VPSSELELLLLQPSTASSDELIADIEADTPTADEDEIDIDIAPHTDSPKPFYTDTEPADGTAPPPVIDKAPALVLLSLDAPERRFTLLDEGWVRRRTAVATQLSSVGGAWTDSVEE